MNRRNFFVIFTIAIFILTAFWACEKKPTAPLRDNPFDPKNVDPFKLTAQISNGGILLRWTLPDFNALQSFNIYRSEQQSSDYNKIATVGAKQSTYIDKNIENGHSYWYGVTAVNNKGIESTRTNIVPVNIKTSPVLVINGGAQYTPTRQVQLTLLAATATQMMLSNTADFSNAQWEPYTTAKTWTLENGDGEKTVYMKAKYDNETESETVNKKIILDTTPPTIALTVTPDSGITGETTFQFDPTGSRDNLAPAADLRVRYDYENDGTYDTSWEQLQVTSSQFPIGGGDKTVKMQLKDAVNWITEKTVTIFVNTRPQAEFTATRDNTNYRVYHFDASASNDYEDGHNLQYRWDFDGDSVFDTAWITQDTISHVFDNYGTYQTQLIVRDQSRLTGQKTGEIQVHPPFVEMIFVQGGTFQMGDTWGDGDSDEKPVHTVTINSFYIGKYEVTQAQYQEIMGTNPSYFKGDNRPVERVSWHDAVGFCNKLSERKGLEPCYTINGTDVICDFTKNGYRLPTEAEWEYASRGGSRSAHYRYAGSNDVDAVAWYYDSSGSQTHEVGSKEPNELGIYDMSGNVYEWCWDWYASDYYRNSPQDNPTGPSSGSGRVIRGGSWDSSARSVRVAYRSDYTLSYSSSGIGFRLLRKR